MPDTEGYVYTVYDGLDRPIMTQDVLQRPRSEWTVTRYDAHGRVVYTALASRPNLTRKQLQQTANDYRTVYTSAGEPTALSEKPSSTSPAGFSRPLLYTNEAFPYLTAADQLLSITYYDSHDFNQDGQPDAQYSPPTAANLGGAAPVADLRLRGQATRSEVRVLGVPESDPAAWVVSTTFLDEQGRPVQVQGQHARGMQEVATTRYDFSGKALSSYALHEGPNHTPIPVQQTNSYDHAGRLLSTTQKVDGGATEPLLTQTYNELGQLASKTLGPQLQTLHYDYNIRGWLTGINKDPALANLWGMRLDYEQGVANEFKQYNGNIAMQRWYSQDDRPSTYPEPTIQVTERAYGYHYDARSRLIQADFVARKRTGSQADDWGQERYDYRLWGVSYDANGNLLTLRRRGLVQKATRTTPAQHAETDNLRYHLQPDAYVSNRLRAVDDLAPAAAGFGPNQPDRPDFSDQLVSSDYSYDAGGSLLSDQNKGISQITYNFLRLPERIEWSNGNALEYVYTAAGQKVAKRVIEAGKPPVRTDYLGAWQYEGDSLRWMNTSEGRVLRSVGRDRANQVLTSYTYEYTLKDHLGNLRVAFRPGRTTTYIAEFENNASELEREQHEFDSASVSPPIRIVDPTHQVIRTGNGAAKLNAGGNTPRPLAALKQLAVAKGDWVDVTAYGLCPTPGSGTPNFVFSLAGYIASALQQQPVLPASPDGRTKVRVFPLLSAAMPLLSIFTPHPDLPTAYLQVLVFNKDSVLTEQYRVPLTIDGEYQPLQKRLFIRQAGYVTTYVANESDVDVYFDNITVEHEQGLQVQETHYDPFGIELAGLSTHAPGLKELNKYTWNGKEKQDKFGLNWHDHGWRFYDPAVGRWHVVDPDAEEGDQESWGTYQFGLDNAVRYNDLDGRKPWPDLSKAYNESIKSLKSAVKSLPVTKLEFNMSFGVQFGIETPVASVEVAAASVKVASTTHTANFKKGTVTTQRRLGSLQTTTTTSKKGTVDLNKQGNPAKNKNDKLENTGSVEVESKLGISLLGFGGERGVSQKIDGNLLSSDEKRFQKLSYSTRGLSTSITTETNDKEQTNVRSNASMTFGASFILGVEMKLEIEQPQGKK